MLLVALLTFIFYVHMLFGFFSFFSHYFFSLAHFKTFFSSSASPPSVIQLREKGKSQNESNLEGVSGTKQRNDIVHFSDFS